MKAKWSFICYVSLLIILCHVPPNTHKHTQKFFEYLSDIYGLEGFCIRPILVRPRSRGTITLKSTDPRDPPNIDPQLLTHRFDVETLVAGQYILRICLSIRHLFIAEERNEIDSADTVHTYIAYHYYILVLYIHRCQVCCGFGQYINIRQ